jgi:Transcriptional activator TraM
VNRCVLAAGSPPGRKGSILKIKRLPTVDCRKAGAIDHHVTRHSNAVVLIFLREAGFERNQTAWSEEAKSLAQKSLNAALRAARENSVRLLEDSSRENAALIRKAFDDGFGRMRETLALAQVIVWLALTAALVSRWHHGLLHLAPPLNARKRKRGAEKNQPRNVPSGATCRSLRDSG